MQIHRSVVKGSMLLMVAALACCGTAEGPTAEAESRPQVGARQQALRGYYSYCLVDNGQYNGYYVQQISGPDSLLEGGYDKERCPPGGIATTDATASYRMHTCSPVNCAEVSGGCPTVQYDLASMFLAPLWCASRP